MIDEISVISPLHFEMPYRFILVLPFVHADFNIDIRSVQRGGSNEVSLTGQTKETISDKERSSFGLTDQNVKDGVELYFGKRPTDVYLRSPTPGNLYETYEWQQVSKTLRASGSRIVNVATKSEMIAHQVYENLEAVDTVVNVAMRRTVGNTVTIKWNTEAELTASRYIRIDVSFTYKSLKYKYRTKLYEEMSKTEPMTIGTDCFLNVTLQPGKSIISELHATKAVVRSELDYEAYLSGVVAACYAEKYKGHRFWALDVLAIMEHAELKNSVMVEQNVVGQFYENPRLIVRDRENGNLIFKGLKCPYDNVAVVV